MQLSGRRVDDSFSIDDVGSTLLEDLAKGLYIPEEVLREYIQNAIDAHRQWKNITGTEPEGAVQVEIRDEAISILDYGIGMDENDIKRVKAIAVSNKPISLVRLTGHKGVGIWAGLSYFDHITIKSTKRGVDHRYELTIWFKKIVESINDNTNIGQALNPNYEIYEYPDDTSYHYTIVTLYSPSRGKEIFLDEANVMKAINSICPCKIDPTFVYHSDLCNWYSANEFETYDIKVNGKIVYRSFPSNVTDFKTGTLTINDRPVAKYWHVINKRNGKLDEINDQLTGFRIIQNGFTLGEQNLYSKENMIGYDELKVGQLINWYVGEFHVILPDLRPNLRRNGFEESEITRQFIKKIREWYKNLGQETRFISKYRNTKKEYEEYSIFLESIKTYMELSIEELEKFNNIASTLSKHKQEVDDNNRKKNVNINVRAYRELTQLRNRLLNIIAELHIFKDNNNELSVDTDQFREHGYEENTDNQVCGFGQDIRSGSIDTNNGEDESYDSKENDENEERDITNSDNENILQLLLGLLSEVLEEEIPDDFILCERIKQKIKKRFCEVTQDYA